MNKDQSILIADTLIKYIDEFLGDQKGTQFKITNIGKAKQALLRLKKSISALDFPEINKIVEELKSYEKDIPDEHKGNYNGYLSVLEHYLNEEV